MINLCLKSLLNRTFIAGLTIFSIALSVALILGVERLRTQARAGFANSASGIDLIVAARGNDVQILLSTVFGVGSTGAGVNWESYEMLRATPKVAWAVPVMIGDNHRGYPVIGTSASYFDHFRHSGGQALAFESGAVFASPEGAVIGAEIAEKFGYEVGTQIINAHGAGSVAFHLHDEAPFTVSGILSPTGTAADRMVYVSLEGFDDLHKDATTMPVDPFSDLAQRDKAPVGEREHDAHDEGHEHDAHDEGHEHDAHDEGHDHDAHDEGHEHDAHDEGHEHDAHDEGHDHDAHDEGHEHDAHDEGHEHDAHDEGHDHDAHDEHHEHDGHAPASINAVYVGLTDRAGVLSVQRAVAEYREEALTAVLPNVALLQLWSITGTAESALRLMAAAVALAGVIGMLVMLSATLETRRREFAILRSVGATPISILGMIVVEAVLLLIAGIVLGYALLTAVTFVADPILSANLGLRLGHGMPTLREGLLIGVVFCSGVIASAVPAVRVYKMTLNDGLSMRL